MAAPTSYTEDQLAKYMHDVLGDDELAAALDWRVEHDDYEEAVNESLLVYGVDSIDDITGRANIRKLRAIARAEVWRLVMSKTAGDYDVKLDSDSYSRSQLHKHAKAMYEHANSEAIRLGVTAYQHPEFITGTAYADFDAGYWSGNTS